MSCTMRGMTVCVHLSLECDRPRKSEIGLANPLRDATSNKICKEAVVGKAVWNNAVLAESETYETVDGNIYFTMDALNREYLNESETTTDYSWKGAANYLSVMVDGEVNADAAWYYAEPEEAAANIRDHVAFWRGVQVSA